MSKDENQQALLGSALETPAVAPEATEVAPEVIEQAPPSFADVFNNAGTLRDGDLGAIPDAMHDQVKVDSVPFPDDEQSLTHHKTPWFKGGLSKDIDGNVKGVHFGSPRLAEIAEQDWFGWNLTEVEAARLEAFGVGGKDPNATDDYIPSEEELLEAADKWGLSSRHYATLAKARSPEDLQVLAKVYQGRDVRATQIDATNTGPVGFLTRVGVNAFDPAFIATGGGSAALLRVGSSATRTGNAIRGLAASVTADAPLELARTELDPDATLSSAATAVLISGVFGGALGGLNRGISGEDLAEIDEILADALNGDSSSVGARQRGAVWREGDNTPLDDVADAPEKAGFNVYGIPLNFLERSSDAMTRKLGAMISWNPNTKGLQKTTAAEAQRRIYESGATYVRQARMAAKDFYKGTTGFTGTPNSKQIDDFMTIVAQVHAGVRKSDNPHVNRAVQAFRDGYEDTLKYVKDQDHVTGRTADDLPEGEYRGLETFRDVEHDPAYVMRRFNPDGYNRVVRKLQGVKKVSSKLGLVIYRSNRTWLASLSKKMGKDEGELARLIANKYMATVDRLTNPAMRNAGPHRPVQAADRESAKEVVREVFNEGAEFADDIEDAIEMVLDLIAPQKKKSAESNRARPRMKLDLDAELDGDILDMFDWNAEALFTTYRRQLSGQAGFLKAGFNSVAEFNAEVAKIRSRSSGDPKRQGRASREAENLEGLRDAILGIPPAELMKRPTWAFVTNQIKRLNFGNLMGNTSFLAVSEVAGVMLRVGPFRMFNQLPEFRKFYSQARAGDPEVVENLFNLADATMGHGSHQLRSRLSGFNNRYEGNFEDLVPTGVGLQRDIDTATRKQANWVARMSGMGPLQEFLRMTAATGEAQAYVKFAAKGKKPYSPARMRAMGIDDDMWTRISAQLNKMENEVSPDTGKPVPKFDLDAWDDAGALDAFINALDRNARRVVLEGDIGHQNLISSHSPFMNLLFQFLNFPLNAGSKHLGFALSTWDMRAVAEVMAMALGGGVGYMARVRAQASALADREEREKFLDERWTMQEMVKATFYYSAHASLIPNAVDLGAEALKLTGAPVEPVFSKSRSSGLAGDPFMGNPTRSRFYSMLRSAGGFASGTPGSEEDFQKFVTAWAPMGNHIITQAFLNRALEGLPEEEDDDS